MKRHMRTAVARRKLLLPDPDAESRGDQVCERGDQVCAQHQGSQVAFDDAHV